LTVQEKKDYNLFKEAILREFKITAKSCSDSFRLATRRPDETTCQFATRLKALFSSYLEIKKIEQSYERLHKLVLADRLKQTLGFAERCHVADRELEQWLSIEKIAVLIDNYEVERGTKVGNNYDRFERSGSEFANNNEKKWNCDNCGTYSNHSTSYCRRGQNNGGGKNIGNMNGNKPYFTGKTVGQNGGSRFSSDRKVKTNAVNILAGGEDFEIEQEEGCAEGYLDVNRVKVKLDGQGYKQGDKVTEEFLKNIDNDREEKMIQINFGTEIIPCLLDSGTQVTVLSEKLLSKECVERKGKVLLRSAFGEIQQADLCEVSAELLEQSKEITNDRTNTKGIKILVAMTNKLVDNYGLLAHKDYEMLLKHQKGERIDTKKKIEHARMRKKYFIR